MVKSKTRSCFSGIPRMRCSASRATTSTMTTTSVASRTRSSSWYAWYYGFIEFGICRLNPGDDFPELGVLAVSCLYFSEWSLFIMKIVQPRGVFCHVGGRRRCIYVFLRGLGVKNAELAASLLHRTWVHCSNSRIPDLRNNEIALFRTAGGHQAHLATRVSVHDRPLRAPAGSAANGRPSGPPRPHPPPRCRHAIWLGFRSLLFRNASPCHGDVRHLRGRSEHLTISWYPPRKPSELGLLLYGCTSEEVSMVPTTLFPCARRIGGCICFPSV